MIRLIKILFIFCFIFSSVLIVLNLFFPLPEDKLNPEFSKVILDKNGKILNVFTTGDGMWRIPVQLEEVSPYLRECVIGYEDRYFYYHFGVNPVALLRALYQNIKYMKIISGGSTITMQVARMMERRPRTLKSKIIEIFRSLQLELKYSKDEILNFYFNMAPYGGNIEGIYSASYLYFKKAPSKLSLGEAAMLVAIPKSPSALRPDKFHKLAKDERDKVLKRLLKYKFISQKEYKDAIKENAATYRYQFPFEIPHLSFDLVNKNKRATFIHSSIDYEKQKLCEKLLDRHISKLKNEGITNGAVVIIRNSTGEVEVLIGSNDFFDEKNSGQVNGATSPRSPGSTLKPFVYALAMEAGKISPESIIDDIPVDYSGYTPENFDGNYSGFVKVYDALQRSLNVPAVNLAAGLRDVTLYEFLKQNGITTLNRKYYEYGLPLVLGACELTLLELTNLYTILGRFGTYIPYTFLKDGNENEEYKEVLSPEVCFLISEILSDGMRVDLPTCWEFTINRPKVAWKTGTSYGHKDAWTIAYNPEYTIGVWIGNFSGEGTKNLVGSYAAEPLLFDIFNTISTDNKWYEKPKGVKVRTVCALSGMPASPHCPDTKEEYFIPGKSPATICNFHKKYIIDDETGKVLCHFCKDGRKFHEKLFTIWPAKYATWLEKNGNLIDKIPSHYEECVTVKNSEPPIIKSPSDKGEYFIRDGIPEDYQKILFEASVQSGINNIFWFIDGELIKSVTPLEIFFFLPLPGKHEIVCMDENGIRISFFLPREREK